MKMKSFCRRRCIVIVYLMMTPVNLQMPMGYPMPMGMPMAPPMFAMPPPMPIGVPVPVPMILRGVGGGAGGDSTTTTTEANRGIEQIALPVEISIYPPRPDRYPNFYPSPYPGPPPGPFPPAYAAPPFGLPLPMPMMPPPPRIAMPKRHKKKRDPSLCTNCEPISSEESCSDETRRRRRKNGYRIKRTFRRMIRSDEIDDNALVKPVLTYVSNNGDIKLEQRLSNNDAADLIDDDKSFQKLSILAGEDSDNKPRVLVVSDQQNNDNSNRRHGQVILRPGSTRHALGEGRKELVFRPPVDKKISNFSVSFQVSDR